MLHSMEDFLLEQTCDDTLRFALDQVIKTDGHVVRPDTVQAYPHFSLIRDILCTVSCETQTGKEMTQSLVSKKPGGGIEVVPNGWAYGG